MASRLSIAGNLVVLGVVAGGGWLVWSNATRSADKPSSAEAVLADAAEEVGYDRAARAPRAGQLRPAQVTVGPTGLAVPVDGVRPTELVDTYTQSRAGGARVHNAIDIMAPRGRPVVAAAPGTVEKLYYSNGGGGITVYVRSPDQRWQYYYAHLDAYAPGLKEGQQVTRGTPLGTVGISGNANPSGPHLHFAINRMEPGWRWHQGEPINPYPLLAGRTASR
ncbi:M23 family metallopeptidase [Sphingomonas arenae]|uniref:M23 family metallopeptidase n=1 Tax=Sphingomonas arenae TaxID=2812555 RepID=UPI001967EA8D|nr:peptidoglycan DD-metalloendopeptidase family protein [Sphingomonas arenae]